MAISINWATKVISVPKADMTLIQASPTEIRELDTNQFRLDLKALEAEIGDTGGMPSDTTHTHNPPVTVGGVTLARVIEIINGYTVTFEDDQYAVNLVGSNNNIADVTNVNQVSIRSGNSAGLVTSAAIEFGEYGAAVHVKPSLGNTGTVYPAGTLRQPVSNLTDALTIVNSRGFNRIIIMEDMTVQDLSFDDLVFEGLSETDTNITIAANASVQRCKFTNAVIDGVLDGGSKIEKCEVLNISFFNGIIDNSILEETITLGGNVDATITNCQSGVAGQDTPRIDMGGDGPSLILRNYNGGIEITNKTGVSVSANSSFDINSGQVKFAANVTEGTFAVRGIGKLTDNTDPNSNAVIENEILDPVQINKSLFNDSVDVDIMNGTTGNRYPTGTPIQPAKDLANASIIAGVNNLTKYKIIGTANLDQDYNNWEFQGIGSNGTDINFNSSNVNGCIFVLSTVRGTMVNTSGCEFRNCVAISVQDFYGKAIETAIVGSWTISNGANARFVRCSSGFTEPTLDLNNIGKLVSSQYNGNITLSNLNMASSEVIFDFASGEATIDNTCSAGNIILRGAGNWNNKSTYSGNATVIDLTINPDNVWRQDISGYATLTNSAGNALLDASGGNINVSGLTSDQANMLLEIYTMYGLDPTKPLVVSNSARTAGGNIVQTIDCNTTTSTTTITRV